jgi:ABC-type amino acid transport substrate-binding protein
MRQSATDLVSYVNVVLQDLKDSGQYDIIVQKWFP